MRSVLQRVSSAEVRVAGEVVGRIGCGLLVLVAVEAADSEGEARQTAERLTQLRVFADAAGKMNLAASEAGGEFLLVSQFTLAGNPLGRGRRPSFDGAAPSARGQILFDLLAGELRARGFRVETGRFGAHMDVVLHNDGPVTFVLDVPERRVETRESGSTTAERA
jgi:D-tyrosyl-tRNA(Tyr) deacylase